MTPVPPSTTTNKSATTNAVLSFDTDVDASALSSLVGGKGLNLILLSRAAQKATSSNSSTSSSTVTTLKVPFGFCVTTLAYQALLGVANLQGDIEAALAKLDADHGNLDDVSEEIQAAFFRRQLPSDICDAIQTHLVSNSNVQFVAVRSSATCEDLGDASFAGQHDTYLHVPATLPEVCQKVVECCASLYTPRAIAYRLNNHVDHAHAYMAVVVQTMVASVASGVLFTANPLTGHRHQLVLEAVGGLGEALVSGLTEPDHYLVQKTTNNDYDIVEKKVGAKKKTIRPKVGGGVQVVELQDGDKNDVVLSDTTVLDLVRLGTTIQELYHGEPQDVEWALGPDNILNVVQSRPITTLFPVPPLSSKGNDSANDDDLEIMFSFGAIQGFAMPIYPAGQDAVRSLLGSVVKFASWGRNGTGPDAGKAAIRTVGERVFVNVTRIIRNRIGRKVIRKLMTMAEPGILAGVDKVLEMDGDDRLNYDSGMSPFVFVRLTALWLGTFLPGFIYSWMFPERSRAHTNKTLNRHVAQLQKQADELAAIPDTTLAHVVQFKREILGGFATQVAGKIIPQTPVIFASMWMLNKMAIKKLGDQDGKERIHMLVRGLPHNPTTEMDLKLWSVAQTIRGNAESKHEFQTKSAEQLADDYLAGNKLTPCAQQAVKEFMDMYGMRGLYEIDFGRPRWREEPAPLMQTIQNYVDMDDPSHAPDELFRHGEQAAHEAIAQLGKDLNRPRLVAFLAHRLRVLASLREIPKFTIIRLMGIIRAKLIEQGEKLVTAGVLEHARDVFLLHDEELEELAASPKGRDWKALVAERKQIMERETLRTGIPRVLTTDGYGYYGGAPIPPGFADRPNVLIGEPVSPGTIEGIVRVVYDPSKTKLVQGEVLVCHGTDPSWTPLFLSACALVMEVGGLVTHGSIVAREVGIPAVVGVDKVTDRLKTGQRIRVDGSTGIVEILDVEDEAGKAEGEAVPKN